ncbi:phospholipase D-like domain-containing protein [Luteimonas kalidii]|uniref:Phospholipase D-like domain-containing protein n=1 Tax=Luteimonas kalidii TaxID=3042025 RepID=A0ABT6JVH0_9GAMM|nr:phospholipase D-like domain-containing protein [Luteimonas kalidii]MDH5833946.1 phospholipase D-like domain-containing protein [Luteimonas kalidii]
MEFVGRPLAGGMLHNAHLAAIEDCVEVKAAIAYAQQGVDKILLFDDCLRKGKKLTFYGRVDGTCPIDLRVLNWFLRRNSPNAICKLVPHWLHAKVIWWVGQGAYIGSANLTDRAWFKNYEAGIYLTHEELEQFGLILELEDFFDGLEQNSFPLDDEEYERQVKIDKRRAELLKKLKDIQQEYEDGHWKLKDRTTPITVAATRKTKDKRLVAFKQEWGQTLQLIRSVGARVSLDENRPDWIASDVPQGVQGDQFLHAYYYQRVRPNSEKNAYLREFNKHRNNPEAALSAALAWWKGGAYEHEHEEGTIYQSAPLLRALFGKGRITTLDEQEWVSALTNIYAFGDHASKVSNGYLGLGTDPGGAAKGVALAHMLWTTKTINGMSAPEMFDFVIWGKGNVAERIWTASHEREFKLHHIGTNILGEVVGWARPTEYPPRNSRTSKALCALGNDVEVVV